MLTYTYTYADHMHRSLSIGRYRSLLDSVVGICLEIWQGIPDVRDTSIGTYRHFQAKTSETDVTRTFNVHWSQWRNQDFISEGLGSGPLGIKGPCFSWDPTEPGNIFQRTRLQI